MGIEDALERVKAEAYEQGRLDAGDRFEEGKSVGYTLGYDDGKTASFADGKNAGYEVGYDDGREDGYRTAQEEINS